MDDVSDSVSVVSDDEEGDSGGGGGGGGGIGRASVVGHTAGGTVVTGGTGGTKGS